MRNRLLTAGAVTVALATAFVGTAGPASASGGRSHPPVVSAPLADGLAGPLQVDADGRGVLVAQSFSGTVSLVDRTGTHDLFDDPGTDGVAWGPFGSIVYTHTESDDSTEPPTLTGAELRLRTPKGETRTLADLRAYEDATNPDRVNHYGVQGLSDECAALFPPEAQVTPYTGGLDSHPYALRVVRDGAIVADAAANAILFVSWRGDIRTLAVLPPQAPVTITAEAAAANQLPDCVVGRQLVAEPVPTDVEIGHDGRLYVSTLPGGPEDPTLGGRGSVYRVNPWNGTATQVATGFLGAANLAVAPNGTIYVSELFGDRISKVVCGRIEPVVSVPSPSALEWANGRLYVGTETFGPGKLVTVSL